MGKYFGTDGIRGRANEALTPEMAYVLGRASAAVLAEGSSHKRPLLLIGRDTRISGTMLESALAAGFAASGCDVLLLGVIPTPGVAALTRLLAADASAVISASHNPYYDNGIKFFNEKGYKLPDQVEARIEALIDAPESIPVVLDEKIGVIDTYNGAAERYLDWVWEQLHPDLSGLKIVVDAANGASSPIAEKAFRGLGAEVVMLSDSPDGCNINTGCGSTHMENLCEKVVEAKANLGIAFDGDADRMLAVDENGALVDGDQIIAAIAAYLKEKNALDHNAVVITVMTNMGFRIAMDKLGINVEETKVGDRYVLERMQEMGGIIGGEQSGHVILSNHNTTGDGLVSALQLLTVVQESGRKLSELVKVMERLPQVLKNVKVKSKAGLDTDADILQEKARIEEILKGRGRLLLRPSGTEPIVRVMAEGDDLAELEQLVGSMSAIVERQLG